MKFDGDFQQLGFFLAHILIYMQEYRPDISTEGAKVTYVILALEGAATRRVVTFHNMNNPELRNFIHFMNVLHCWFEDPFADQKARDHIKTMRQGHRAMAEYAKEVRDLVC